MRGRCLGLNTDEPCFVCLKTVPMGWISAVGVAQAAIRTLAFDMAKIPLDKEVQKWKSLPEGDRYLLYLDSVDQLRPVSKAMARLVSGEASEEHERFEKVCQDMGLPRNESKRLDPNDLVCGECRRDMAEDIGLGQEVECPLACGKRFCRLDCFLEHAATCENCQIRHPTFSERWSGPNAPLTECLVRKGVVVEPPFDLKRDSRMDYFSDEGKGIWKWLDQKEPTAEHHAPECKTFARRRGQPFWIGKRWFPGPPALRDEANIMGFSNLRGSDAVKVRHGNKMALRSIQLRRIG